MYEKKHKKTGDFRLRPPRFRWNRLVTLTTIIIFLSAINCNGQLADKYKSDKVVITFDSKTEIIDTIYVDTSSTEYATVSKYVLNFTNTGTEPLIIQYSGGCDPCFISDLPKSPIKPGQKSSITITCANDAAKKHLKETKVFQFTKQWTLITNAKNEVTIKITKVYLIK